MILNNQDRSFTKTIKLYAWSCSKQKYENSQLLQYRALHDTYLHKCSFYKIYQKTLLVHLVCHKLDYIYFSSKLATFCFMNSYEFYIRSILCLSFNCCSGLLLLGGCYYSGLLGCCYLLLFNCGSLLMLIRVIIHISMLNDKTI